MTKQTDTEGTAWWERLVDSSSEGAAGKFLRPIAAIAVVTVLGITAWNFFSKSSETDRDRVADVIYQGLALLPDTPPARFYGVIPDMRYRQVSFASFFYWSKTQDYQPFKSMYYGLVDPEKSKEFYDKIGGVLGEFRDVEGDVADSPDAWLYWLTRSELHWYAALNSPDVSTRIEHFEKQITLLDRMAGDLAGHPILDLHPDPKKPDATVVDLWKEAARGEIDFLRSDLEAYPGVQPDEGLEAVIKFTDGGAAKLRFFSAAAPKTVMTFITHARAGRYDGTAVHGLDATAGSIALGDPLSKEAERPMIWHKGDAGFTIPPEITALLPVAKGFVSTENAGNGGHGFHFLVHVKDPETPNRSVTVFAEVVEGLEHFEALLDEEVFDEAGAENPSLPRRRIGIESVTVTGEIQNMGDDSWRPLDKDAEVPEITEDEKALDDKYFGRAPEEGEGEGGDEEPAPPGKEPEVGGLDEDAKGK